MVWFISINICIVKNDCRLFIFCLFIRKDPYIYIIIYNLSNLAHTFTFMLHIEFIFMLHIEFTMKWVTKRMKEKSKSPFFHISDNIHNNLLYKL